MDAIPGVRSRASYGEDHANSPSGGDRGRGGAVPDDRSLPQQVRLIGRVDNRRIERRCCDHRRGGGSGVVKRGPSQRGSRGCGCDGRGSQFGSSYSGTLTKVLCVGSGATTTASFNAVFAGQSGTLPGDIGSTEFGFQGPAGTDFDSGFLDKALDTDGKGFDVDGIVAKDESGKSVTMHGTLVCP
jgi:hypothetical protein